MGASKIKYSPDTYVESMAFELEIVDPMSPGVSGGVRLSCFFLVPIFYRLHSILIRHRKEGKWYE